MEEEKSEEKGDFTSKIRKNPWIAATIVLGLATLILVILALKPGLTGNVVSGADAGSNLIDYLNAQVGGGVEYVSYQDLGNLYEVDVTYNGQDIPVYVTKDGKYFISSIQSITGEATQTDQTQTEEATKSDKPVVELFVFSYCPYGLQAEKGFIPVYNLLKNKADIKIEFIGAMHGQYEETESLRQLCIKKNYGVDKFMSYIEKFSSDSVIGACGSDETCSKPLVEKLMTSLGINVNTINSCMTSDAEALYEADEARASQLGVTGSPTLVVNGVTVSSGRSSQAFLSTICSAFNTEPGECSQTLSDQNPSAGFGSSTSSSSSSSSCG